ncbi:MAG: iron ABC transporter permease [Rhodospirillales bacterium]|nr:iron ABC transporter permease [Rhodospirillales bacterium]MDP6644269.1 iron ABC transporter permease [Rhodospirillales bacterium]
MAAIAALFSGRRGGDLGAGGVLVLGAGVVAALYFISAPLFTLVSSAFRGPEDLLPFEDAAVWTLDHFFEVYTSPVLYQEIIPQTLIFAIGAVAFAFFVAFTLAWLVERTDLPGRNLFFTLILFPLLVPTLMLGIAWVFMFGPNAGWINQAIRFLLGMEGSGPFDIFSMTGLILAQGAALVPFVFLLLTAALRSMNPSLEEASVASGASPFTTFFRVTLPVLRPGILAPLILAFLVAMEQFELPLIIGLPARINVFSIRIFFELTPNAELPIYGRAASLALPFLGIGILLLLMYNHFIRQADSFVTVTGKGYRPERIKLGNWKWPALAFVTFFLAFVAVLPALVLLWTSFFGFNTPSFGALANLSFTPYIELFQETRFYRAIGNTFLVAGGSAVIVTLIGVTVAWILVRTKMPGRVILDFVSFFSIAIPSVIAGLAAMLLYLSMPIGVYGTVWVLILAYSYRFAVTTRLNRAGLMQLHKELEEASYAAGGTWITTVRRVVLPLMGPSILASLVLLFIIGFREFTIPLILMSEDNMVLSIILWRLFENLELSKAAAVGILIIIFVIPIIFLMRRFLLPKEGAN